MKIRRLHTMMIAGTLAGGLPFERMLLESDPGAGGGGGAPGTGAPPGSPPPKTYTDAEVNAMIARERTKLEAKSNEALATTKAELEAKVAELTQQVELAGKSAEEKTRIQAEQAAKRLRDEGEAKDRALAAEKARADQADSKLRAYVQRTQASSALAAAKVFPQAMDYAVDGFLREAQDIDADPETGSIKSLTIDGVRYTDIGKAAEEFLSKRTFLKSAPAGGGGTGHPTGTGAGPEAPLRDRAASALRDAMGGLPGMPLGQRGG